MEHGFLQLTAFSPCFSWNQQALEVVEDLEVGAGVGELLERGFFRGRARDETRFTCRDLSRTLERRFTEEEETLFW